MPSLYEFANPVRFEKIAALLIPWLIGATVIAAAAGLYFAFGASPEDYQQFSAVRMMYVHVPAAWMALFCYSVVAFSSAVGFIWKHPLADVAAKEAAPIGAGFTLLALITGSIWGKPMWGAWWAWDARLTSVLVLFFLYLGYIAIWRTFEDKTRAARLAAILAMVGFVNVPIIKFSVDWWNSLHQPASVFRVDGPTIDPSMLTPLFLLAIAYMLFFSAALLQSMRNELMERRLARLQSSAQPQSATLVNS